MGAVVSLDGFIADDTTRSGRFSRRSSSGLSTRWSSTRSRWSSAPVGRSSPLVPWRSRCSWRIRRRSCEATGSPTWCTTSATEARGHQCHAARRTNSSDSLQPVIAGRQPPLIWPWWQAGGTPSVQQHASEFAFDVISSICQLRCAARVSWHASANAASWTSTRGVPVHAAQMSIDSTSILRNKASGSGTSACAAPSTAQRTACGAACRRNAVSRG
jgi:hypothetical protein